MAGNIATKGMTLRDEVLMKVMKSNVFTKDEIRAAMDKPSFNAALDEIGIIGVTKFTDEVAKMKEAKGNEAMLKIFVDDPVQFAKLVKEAVAVRQRA